MLAVIGAFLGAFIVVPYIVLPRPKGARSILDAVAMNLVRWMAVVIVGMHILVVFGLNEMLSIIILSMTGFYFSKLRPVGWRLPLFRELIWDRLLRAFDLIDRLELRARVGLGDHERLPRAKFIPERPKGIPRRSPFRLAFLAIIPGIVVGYSFWLRARFALDHLSLSPPDAYHHMAWAKEMIANNIFTDGIYPHGIAAVLAFVNKFDGSTSMLDVTRFMGPVIGTLLICGIFYTVYRFTDNAAAATFAAGTLGFLGTRPEWHEPWSRQTGALPQELALAVLLFALPSAVLAVVDRERDHLWTVGAAAVAMGFIHPVPVPVFVALAGVGALVAGVIGGELRRGVEVVGVAVVGALAGFCYMPLARLAGVPYFQPIRNLTPFARPGENSNAVELSIGEAGYSGFARLAVPALILGILAGIVVLFLHDGRNRSAKLLGLCAMGTVIVVLYDVNGLGLDPYYANRLAQVIGPQMAVTFGVGFAALTHLVPRQRATTAFAALLVSLASLGFFSSRYPASAGTQETVEYEATARITERISHEYERYTYTIVGTPQQRQVTLGDGWFVEAWVFARDATMRSARDPGYQMVSRQGVVRNAPDVGFLVGIPTQDVFITVEKKPFAGPQLAADGPTEEYYFDPEKRGRIMARIYMWAEMYMRYHTDMSVYYEDDDIKVYRISRAPDVAGASDSPEFKDYTWKPGALFNYGPTSPADVELP